MRIKFKLYKDHEQCLCLIDATAADIAETVKKYPNSDLWIKANSFIVGNDDILYMSRVDNNWTVNQHFKIPKTLLSLVK